MIAGIVLGPSLVGMYFPEFSALLFPPQSLGNLQFLSQIGLIFFMFIVGMELDLRILKDKAHDAVVISHASIIIPFTMGVGLAYFIYTGFAPEGVQFSSFALFIGIAMSITAFPVLARIVQERNLLKTKLGTVIITCAAVDDITAWCMLAVVIAIVKAGEFVSAFYTILLAVGYVIVMLKVVRPFINRVGELHNTKESLSKPIVAIFFLMLIISSYVTEVIGIHALFGAFMAGAIMPERSKFRNHFIEKVEDVSLVLLLPLFFVFTGLRTQIGLINDIQLWKITGLIILVAVVGKFVGSALAARFVKQNWKDSLTIGALMNTRGLMELVVLNIGYDLGVLSTEIFSMMVIMALVTTFMTGSALDLINRIFKKMQSADEKEQVKDTTQYRVLLSFGRPASGKKLLRLANGLTSKIQDLTEVTAMHIAPANDLEHYDFDEIEEESFREVKEESEKTGQAILTLFKSSADIDNEIINVANKGNFDLLMVGVGKSIYEGTILGKLLGFTTKIINPETYLNVVKGKENIFETPVFDERVNKILSKTEVPVAIFIDKGFEEARKIVVPITTVDDIHIIPYIQKFIHNAGAQVVVVDVSNILKSNANAILKEQLRSIEKVAPNHIAIQSNETLTAEFLQQQDLVLMSHSSWKKAINDKNEWLQDVNSVMIVAQ